MVREKPADQRCQNVLENGDKCGQKIDGQGAWLYCSGCRQAAQAAQREPKRERDRKRSAERRAADPEGDNFYHWLYNYKLTAPQMEDYITPGKALRELYRGLKPDDLCQQVIDQLTEINVSLLDPPDLPGAHASVGEQIYTMRTKLACLPADGLNSPRDTLVWHVKEVERDQGGWLLSNPIPSIGQQAHELQEAWRIRGDLHKLAHALLVKAELWRQRYFATPNNMNLWKKAFRWVEAAAYVASLYKGTRQKISTFYDFYTVQAYITLELDRDTPDEATGYIHAIQDLAKKVADAWGEGPVTDIALYLSSKQQALYHLSRKEPFEAKKHFIDAETLFSRPILWRPVSEHQYMAYMKACLPLERDAPEREELVHDYLALWSRNPSFEQSRNLARFKHFYGSELPETALSKDMPIYVETCFNYLRPLLLPYTDTERCLSEAISEGEEREVMVSV